METQIIELEKKYWQGMVNHNYETVKNLTHFPCIVAGKNGVQSIDEATFKKMFDSSAQTALKVGKFTGVETQEINKNIAVIAYHVEVETGGKKQNCACSSTWVKENNKWSCSLHTETELLN
ncbi:nuclear transport factor 2 family protein [Flavobacterium pedocola]